MYFLIIIFFSHFFRVRKQWQKRYCVISNGLFTLAHNQVRPDEFQLFYVTLLHLIHIP